jgi:nitronate monooxygenase
VTVSPLPSEVPIVQAPMAGGPSTPELTAAVTRAGGYGFVAGGYRTAEQLRDDIAATRVLTGAPFGVNLFVPSGPADTAVVAAYAADLETDARRCGVALGEPRWEDDDYEAKLEVVASAHVDLVSFTFGCPASSAVDRLHRADCRVAVTVTSVAEASAAEAVGADMLAVQGTEAGGHQGSFLDLAPNRRPLLALLDEMLGVTDLPLIGAGGIMTGTEAAEILASGATAIQVGTALLCTPEAGTSPTYRRALLDGRYPETIVTRAFSGRYARGLANEFAVSHNEQAPQAYPEVHHLTRPLRAAATRVGDASVVNLWAGTGWRRVTAEPAGAIVRRMTTDAARPPR